MKTIVVYKSKYGATETYARWIGEALDCTVTSAKNMTVQKLEEYDTIIYGGGLYAEVINGVTLITKNMERLQGKQLIVYTTGLTPLDCREYYDVMVAEKNFRPEIRSQIKVFHFLGKMVASELSLPHRAALKTLKKLMKAKENPTEMERLLVRLCDSDGDFTEQSSIADLIQYVTEGASVES